MRLHKLGPLQRAVLDLARKHEGYVWAELINQELFGHAPRAGHDMRDPIDAATRNTVSRVLASLEKRGLLQIAPEVRGFQLSDKPEMESAKDLHRR